MNFFFITAFIFFCAGILLRLFDTSAALFLKNNINVDYLRIPSKELRKQIDLTNDENLIKELRYQLKYKWVYMVCMYCALLLTTIGMLYLFFDLI